MKDRNEFYCTGTPMISFTEVCYREKVRVVVFKTLAEKTTWRNIGMKQKTGIEGLMQRIGIENRGTRPNPLKEAELRKRQIITRFMKANQGLLELSGQPEAETPRMKMTYSEDNEFARRMK